MDEEVSETRDEQGLASGELPAGESRGEQQGRLEELTFVVAWFAEEETRCA